MRRLTHTAELIGEACLIFEGVALATNRIVGRKVLPPISHIVWSVKPRRFGWVLPVGIIGWLAWHFEYGDQA